MTMKMDDNKVLCVCVCRPYVTDSSIAITVCALLFMLPSQAPNYLFFKTCNKGEN